MILRKPYAILIKNFKLIHMIITFCIGYLVFKSYAIYDYIQSFMKTTMLAVGEDVTASLFNNWMYALPVIIIIGLAILLGVMIKKKKPFVFYIYNIVIFIASIFVYSYLYDAIDYIERNIVTRRDIQLTSDISFVLLVLQAICLVFSAIRALGFDIKKFDFGKDLVELDVSEEDREEFEVEVNVETNVIKRDINRRFRYAKYVYLENKLLINCAALISFAAIFYVIYVSTIVYNTTYKVGDVFSVDGYSMGVNRVYVTQKDYNNVQIIEDDKYLVVVDLKISAYIKNSVLNTAKTILEMNGVDHYPTSVEYRSSISDLGTTYFDEKLSDSYQNILLVYKVSKANLEHTFTFKYLNDLGSGNSKDNPKYIKVSEKPIFLDVVANEDETKPVDVNVGDVVVLNDRNLGTTSLTIKSFDIKKEYSIKYNFCLKNECFDSVEYLKAPLNKNSDQVLLKVNATLDKDPELNMVDLKNFMDLMKYYGIIEYKKDGVTYSLSKKFDVVSPNKVSSNNNYYIAVDSEIMDAEEVYLYLSIRSKNYKYKIK